ncbi:F0F1 ATP synthase subunit delta [Falsiroseomonas selenitidurans]|uniref:ATP synthase F0 subunit B n=1 Tax=Falsiroseomonas selenitidurans TaxID=2716335 RepID=A0ABX1E9G9_9PROT|nr:ATP synthase F0 subunit B [Falsiroseomonas selenitidurans]NKC33603.1 ATP synthase F0 subunit B [Falsiroseomonas selenitidurans]
MSIDWWSLGLQTINVAILVWLLGRFFWRPVAAMIAERRETAEATLKAAADRQAEDKAALADIEKTRAGFAAERDAILAAAQDQAETASKARLAEEASAATARASAASAAIAKDRRDAENSWSLSAATLATAMAGRLATRLDGAAVRAAFLEWLLQGIRAQPEAMRLAAAAEASLEATTATALDAAEQDRCRAAIGEALGGHPDITFTVDAALIAGIELRGRHLEVGNSWRADLARIGKELAHGA